LRLGIFNINTLLITLLLLSSTSTLTYVSFQNNLSFSSPFLYVFIQLISLAFFVFFVSKLRWVWVTKKCIYICYPLRFKLIKSDLKKIRSIKWRIDNSVDGIYYRQFSFITENQKSIILDDLEFENLDQLTNFISHQLKDINFNHNLKKINYKRAINNKIIQLFNLIFASFSTIFLLYKFYTIEIWNTKIWIVVSVISIICLLWLYLNYKKFMLYLKTINSNKG
jgi:hypothetical protein